MLQVLRWIIVSVLLLPALLLTVALALAFYALEDKPLVERNVPVDYATVAAGKSLLKRLRIQVESADDKGTTLLITEDELRHIAQLASHTFARLDTDLYFDSAGVNSRMSVQMPANPFGPYLNLGVQIGQSSDGIDIDRLSIGPLQVSGRWLLPLTARLADVLLKDRQASALLASIRGFRIEGETALLMVAPPPDAKAQLKQAVRTLQASRLPPGEEERVVHYYDSLVAIAEDRGDRQKQSLGVYLAPVMAEAAKRSAGSSAVAENRAAIWATVIYFSNGAFEALVGKLVSSQRPLVRAPARVTLGGRGDLLLHFLYSAGIALATQQGIGIAAGEFKELLDSGNGGSGFSFADLAADRAGIQFVTVATADEAAARRLQERLVASNGEAGFFPDTAGLAEGLSEEQFRQQFGSAESQRYREQLALIDRRIARLPVY